MTPTFYEFFAGGGMARAGLGHDWRCLFANDIDAKKATAYKENWGDAEFRLGDIHDLEADDLPGHADLAWASFPCQDLSLAGPGAGLDGERSGAFWGLAKLIEKLRAQGRAPTLLVLENVGGALTSKKGRDFERVCAELHRLGYVFGALMLDAVHFVPQSRPRLFIVAHDIRRDPPASAPSDEPDPHWTTLALVARASSLPHGLRAHWRWWRLPPPPSRTVLFDERMLQDLTDVRWHSNDITQRLLAMMSPANRSKVDAARRAGRRVVGTIYRRMRRDENGARVQRAEVRFDGIAGCLRTPAGGSSRQTVIVVDGEAMRTRLLSAREAARLMGLPESYRLPANYNDAYHMLGDGLVVPAVRFLAENLLRPLLAASSQAVLEAAE